MRTFLRSRTGFVLLGFTAIAAFYLVTEHTAHVFGALPYALLLLCPLLHLFGHGRHGGHSSHSTRGDYTPGQVRPPDQRQAPLPHLLPARFEQRPGAEQPVQNGPHEPLD